MKLLLFIKTSLPLFLIVSVSHLQAQWSTSANTDNKLGAVIYNGALTYCSDGHGGAIYTWFDQTNNINSIRGNRIDSLGFTRWGSTGAVINAAPGGYSGSMSVCEDGKGGCYVAYTAGNLTNHPLLCQHLDSNGTALWDTTGVRPFAFVRPYQQGQYSPVLVNDNGNGVFIVAVGGVLGGTSDLMGQRLNLNGQKQWITGGVFIDTVWDEHDQQVIADGHNGITMIWYELTYGGRNLKMQRLNHDGVPQFTGGVKYLHSTTPYDTYAWAKIIRTTGNNYIATWVGSYSGGGNAGQKLFSQKLNGSGVSLWPGNAVAVCDTTADKTNTDIVSDGKDGAYYVWADARKVNISYGAYLQHLDSTGVLKWQRQGLLTDSVIKANPCSLGLAPDVNNGMKVFYVDEAQSSNQLYMQVLNSSGAKQLAGLGTPVCAAGHNLYGSVPVGNNHAILFMNAVEGSFAKYVPFGNVLPLTFLAFTAESNGKTNLLNWQTAAEINTKYFAVERSVNGISFKTIAQVTARNNGALHNDYSYEDADIAAEDIFYRINCIDFDGKYTYSKIVSIHRGIISSVQVVPNPVTKNCIVYFEKATDAKTALTLFDINGRPLTQQTIAAGQSQASIDVANLAAGSYFIRLAYNGKIVTRKIVVVR